MAGPSGEERLQRLASARDAARELMEQPPARWENECEGIFKEFRLACVHLRKEREVLDSLEDKQTAWRFICKFTRERPFWHDRCTEVLKILMLSDAWMREFVATPGVGVDDLPPAIAEEFRRRAEEADPSRPRPAEAAPAAGAAPGDGAREAPPYAPRAAPEPPLGGPGPLPLMPAGLAVVVQRCVRARVLVDERSDRWGEIGRGLVVSVSFAQKATEERVRSAARFLLTAKLSTGEKWEPGQQARRPAFGSDAESVVELCKRGEEQGVLIIPQASLVANVGGEDLGLKYDDWAAKESAHSLYRVFAQALRELGQELVAGKAPAGGNPFATGVRVPTIVAATFTGRQFMDLTSAGPFMHSFSF